MAQGKALKFDSKMAWKDVLTSAKTAWMERNTEVVDGERRFRGNNRYTPMQARRGDELVLFVWSGGTLTMFRKQDSIPCGPKTVWEE